MFRSPRPAGAAPAVALVLLAAVPSLTGCTTVLNTQPPRTATEQYLLSQAAIQSIDKLDTHPLKNQRVYLDTTYLDRIDRPFVMGQIRAVLMERGAKLMDKAEEADIIVEARSAGLGINKSDAVLGIPSLPIPIPTVGTFTTPELAIVKNSRQEGMGGVALLAYRRVDRSLVQSVGPAVGRTLMNDWSVLGLRIIRDRENVPKDLE